jgi:hypothetical protein
VAARAEVACVAPGEQDAAHGLLELAHVARPRIVARQVRGQRLHHARHELRLRLPGDARHQQPHQLLELVGRLGDALAQRRHADHVRAEAVVEVVPKAPSARSSDHGRLVAAMTRPAKRCGSRLPRGVKVRSCSTRSRLHLHGHRRLADLVQEECPVRVAALEDAGMVVDGAGEGALAVTEELGLDQPSRETATG